MAKVTISVVLGSGADDQATSGKFAVRRVEEGDDGTMLVLSDWKDYTLGVEATEIEVETGVLYESREVIPRGEGTRFWEGPATSMAYKDIPEAIPVFPTVGILGDSLVTGLAENPASDFNSVLTDLFNASVPGSTADSATAANVSGGPLTQAALVTEIVPTITSTVTTDLASGTGPIAAEVSANIDAAIEAVIIQVPTTVAGDGSDSSTPLQAIIDVVAMAGGGTVQFGRDKTYGLGSPLRLKTGVVLDLNRSTLLAINAATKACMVTVQGVSPGDSSGGDDATFVSDAGIRNGTLDNAGTSVNGSGKTYAMVFIERATRVAVEGCRFINVGSKQGIRFGKLTDACTARRNHITLPVDDPYLTITNAQGINCYSPTVDSYAGGNTDAQLFTEPTDVSTRHTISGNTIVGGTHGVALAAAQGCVVEGNVIRDVSHRGIIMSPVASRNTIVGNTIRDFGSAAILMAFGSHHNSVTGNVCTTTKSVGERDGIRTSFGAADNLIEGNLIEGPTNAGIRAFTGAVRNSFIGNKISGCGWGIRLWSLNTDTGYFQPTGCAHMEGILAQGNTIYGCTIGIEVRQGTTTVDSSSAGIPVIFRRNSISGNMVFTCPTGLVVAEDSPGNMSAVSLLNNAVENCAAPFTAARGTFPLGVVAGNTGFLIGSKTWTPGAIAAAASVSTTLTVLGARGGDQVSCSYSAGLAAGLVMVGSVTANDTVTVTIFNATAGALTPGAGASLRVGIGKV